MDGGLAQYKAVPAITPLQKKCLHPYLICTPDPSFLALDAITGCWACVGDSNVKLDLVERQNEFCL